MPWGLLREVLSHSQNALAEPSGWDCRKPGTHHLKVSAHQAAQILPVPAIELREEMKPKFMMGAKPDQRSVPNRRKDVMMGNTPENWRPKHSSHWHFKVKHRGCGVHWPGVNPGSHTYKLPDLGQAAELLSLRSLIYSGNNTSIHLKGLLYSLHERKCVKYLAQSMVSAQISGHYDDDYVLIWLKTWVWYVSRKSGESH